MLVDALEPEEIKGFILLYRAADRSAELFAVKIRQRFAVRSIGRQGLETLIVEQAAVDVIGAGLGNNVDDAAGRTAIFGAGAGRDDLKFLDRVEGDVDRGTLAARLLAEESVIVITTVQADVVK